MQRNVVSVFGTINISTFNNYNSDLYLKDAAIILISHPTNTHKSNV